MCSLSKEMDFFSAMSDHEVTANEFFNAHMLNELEKAYGLSNVVVWYFDHSGQFLSWRDKHGLLLDSPSHPYREFSSSDLVWSKIHLEGIRTGLTYFDVVPALHLSTEIIHPEGYQYSAHVKCLEKHFHAYYSASMSFGVNGNIVLMFLNSKEEGDFTPEQLEQLQEVYLYIASAYRNFKRHERSLVVAKLQSEIIASDSRAYIITDHFSQIISYNNLAYQCIRDILGPILEDEISVNTHCSWLPFLLGSDEAQDEDCAVRTRLIKNYIFKIHIYDKVYSNNIVERYHWITISDQDKITASNNATSYHPLTQAEQKVAELMYYGLTYKAIADKLFVSYHTVKKHVQNIYIKCGVNSRFELYRWIESIK